MYIHVAAYKLPEQQYIGYTSETVLYYMLCLHEPTVLCQFPTSGIVAFRM